MVDNAEFEISGKNDIQIGDYIGYMQDSIDLTNLIGLWNFSGSVRDESGNDLHEENALENFTAKPTFPSQSSSSKVYGKRSAYYVSTVSGRYLKIPDKRILTSVGADSDYSIVDFSGDFTLTFFIKLSNTGNGSSTSNDVNRIIFDKFNDYTNQGIMLYINRPQGAASTVQNLKIKVGDGTNVNSYSYSLTNSDWDDKDVQIFVVRSSNSLKVYFNNTEVISQTVTGDLTTRADIYLWKEFNETGVSGQNYTGSLVEPSSTSMYGGSTCTYHQMRIYSRALSISELTTLYGLNAPTMTLKFFGRIWKLTDNTTSSRCFAKGLGSIALNTRIDSSILNNDITNIRDKNIYLSGLRVSAIINDLLTNINEKFFGVGSSDYLISNWQENSKASNKGHVLKAKFIAEGSVLDILNDLSVLSDMTFTFTPLGILQIEINNSLLKRGGLLLSNKNSSILGGGKDDTFLCNHLYVCGKLETFTSEHSISRTHDTSNSWSQLGRFSANTSNGFPDVFPISITSVTKDGVEIPSAPASSSYPSGTPSVNSYWIDVKTALIYFFSTSSGSFQYKYKYTYNLDSAEISILNGGANGGSISKISENTTSKTKNGLYARKLSTPRITANTLGNDQDIDTYATNFIAKNKGNSNSEIPLRIQIETSSFIDHIIENNEIGIHYLSRKIGSESNGDISPIYLQIKKIEYHYPNVKTIIEVGDFVYDSFDLERESNENIRQIQSNQF